jgi:hypothetical protein
MSILNENIKEVFFKNTKAELIEGWYKAWETDVDAFANEMEQLVLQHKIYFLDEMITTMIKLGYDDKVVSTRIPSTRLKELQEELSKLKTGSADR